MRKNFGPKTWLYPMPVLIVGTYDENGAPLQTVTDRVYAMALEEALAHPDALCSETELEIKLQYVDGAWKIVTDRPLMAALVGGES